MRRTMLITVRDGVCDILGELKCSVVAELWALSCGSPWGGITPPQMTLIWTPPWSRSSWIRAGISVLCPLWTYINIHTYIRYQGRKKRSSKIQYATNTRKLWHQLVYVRMCKYIYVWMFPSELEAYAAWELTPMTWTSPSIAWKATSNISIHAVHIYMYGWLWWLKTIHLFDALGC